MDAREALENSPPETTAEVVQAISDLNVITTSEELEIPVESLSTGSEGAIAGSTPGNAEETSLPYDATRGGAEAEQHNVIDDADWAASAEVAEDTDNDATGQVDNTDEPEPECAICFTLPATKMGSTSTVVISDARSV